MPPQKQTNIRLDESTFDWLETVAFVHRRSVADELRAAVDEWLDRYGKDGRVRAARELRDPAPEGDSASVSSLTAERKRRAGSSDG